MRRTNVHVDIIDWQGTRGFIGARPQSWTRSWRTCGSAGAGQADADEPTGLMTHHGFHDEGCWAFIEESAGRTRDASGRALAPAREALLAMSAPRRRCGPAATCRNLLQRARSRRRLHHPGGSSARCGRPELPAAARLLGGAGGRIRIRQVGHRAGDPRHPAAGGRISRRRNPVHRVSLPGETIDLARLDPRDSGLPRDPRQAHFDDLPGADDARCRRCTRSATRSARRLLLHADVGRKEGRRAAIEMLALVGFPDPARAYDTYPFELSGGLRQRAMIAMALICRPALLIADEPSTALDVTIQAQILKLIQDLRKELGMALLLITHDLGVVANVAEEVVVMYRGRVDGERHARGHVRRPAPSLPARRCSARCRTST